MGELNEEAMTMDLRLNHLHDPMLAEPRRGHGVGVILLGKKGGAHAAGAATSKPASAVTVRFAPSFEVVAESKAKADELVGELTELLGRYGVTLTAEDR